MRKTVSWMLALIMAFTVFAIPTGAFAGTTPESHPEEGGIYLGWAKNYKQRDEYGPKRIGVEGYTRDISAVGTDFVACLDYVDEGDYDPLFDAEAGLYLTDWTIEDTSVAEFINHGDPYDENISSATVEDTIRPKVRCKKEGTTKITAKCQYRSNEYPYGTGEVELYFYLTVVDNAEYSICVGDQNYDEEIYTLTPAQADAIDIDTSSRYLGYSELYLMSKQYTEPMVFDEFPDADSPEDVAFSKDILDHMASSDSVKWTSSDDSVAFIQPADPEYDNSFPGVYFIGEGQATVTGTAPSGKTASITFNVTDSDWQITDATGEEVPVICQESQTSDSVKITVEATDFFARPTEKLNAAVQIQQYRKGKYQDADDMEIVEGSLTANDSVTVKLHGFEAGRRTPVRVRDIWTFHTGKGTVQRLSAWHYGKLVAKPATPSIRKLTTKSKSITASVGRVYCQHYEVQVARNSKFTSGKKTVRSGSYKDTAIKVRSLSKGKKYYVRVRAVASPTGYVMSTGDVYSSWSKTKTITCK